MNKYIQDTIRNNLRSIIKDLTVPQQKAVSEIVRGLFIAGRPILSHLAQNEEKTAKKQSEKYSHHLGRIDLQEKINDFTLRKTKENIRKTTIIAYDLTDISKESSKKMKNIRRVFDGSKRKTSNGFELHGVGINGILVRLETHEDHQYTRNQTRKKIVEEISRTLDKKGIWVFDRGNDDKQFFKELRHNLKLDFICRLKCNRQVVIKKTGEITTVENLPEGKYEVFLMNTNNTKPDTRISFSLIIYHHLTEKESIRLISNIPNEEYSIEQFVTMYLERWGVENIFKRIKTKFELESIRVFNYQRFLNLISLIQFAVVVSTLLFHKVQKTTTSLTTGVIMFYKRFLAIKSLTFNLDSFISFLQNSLEPLIFRHKLQQPSLFSYYYLQKLGII